MAAAKIEAEQEADRRRLVLRKTAYRLRRALKTELRDSSISQKKLHSKWIKLLRDSKIERVKSDMEIVMQSHKRDVDMKDAHLQQLDVDTEEAEEQTRFATTAHLARIRKIVRLQEERVALLDAEFHHAKEVIKRTYAEEKKELEQAHADEKFALVHHIAVLKEKQELTMEDAQAEYERQREILSSEHLENFHQLKSQMDAKLQALSDHFEDEHTAYITNTDERTQEYKRRMQNEKKLVKDLEKRKERVKILTHSVSVWKTKLMNGNRDEERRNQEMEEGKAGVLHQYRALKSRMRQLHTVAGRRLKRMALGAGQCKAALAEQTATAERILRLQERARRLESTAEKIAPFHDPKGIRPSNRLAALADTMSAGLEQMSIGSGATWRSGGRGGGGQEGEGEQKDAQPVPRSGAPAAPLVTGPGIGSQPSVASVGSELWDNAPEGPPSPVQEPTVLMRVGRAGSSTGGAGGPAGDGVVRLGVGLVAGSAGGNSRSGSGLASGMGSPAGRLEGPSSGRGSPAPIGIVSFEAMSAGGKEADERMEGQGEGEGEGAARHSESNLHGEGGKGSPSSGVRDGATAIKHKPAGIAPSHSSSSSTSFGIAGAARRSRRLGSMALSHDDGLDGAALITQKVLRDGLPPVLARTTALRKADQGAVGQENLLDGFYGRYNRALVDKLALEKHLQGLKQENRRLKELARQHLEGVSVGPGAVEGPNPLFVVNGRSSVVERQPAVGQRPRSTVDGAAAMRSVAKMTIGVRAAVRG